MQFGTKLLHSGQEIDAQTGSIQVPIYLATMFHQTDLQNPTEFDYSRSGNPTRQALEDKMAQLENGSRGLAFASGMAALSAVFMLLSQGDHLLVTRDCQGGTQRVLGRIFSRFGIEISYVDTHIVAEVQKAIQPNTKMILLENFSNPFLHVSDLTAIAKLAKEANPEILIAVDNTFVTPLLQQPLDLGADIVIHSATKGIAGHADVMAGVLVVKNAELGKSLYFIQNATGGILSPQDSYLVMRGLKTLQVRMQAAQKSALSLAHLLFDSPAIAAVHYPGLTSHPEYALAQSSMRGFGNMISFRLKSPKCLERFVAALTLPVVGAGLGGTETMLSVPSLHCHAALSQSERDERLIGGDLLRVSVGLEAQEDLLADFQNALSKC